MNLQENYRRLFKGRISSNDKMLISEANSEAAKEIYDNPKIERQLSRLPGYESITPGKTKKEVYIYFNKESGAKLAVKALEKLVPGPNYEYYKENDPGYSQPMFVIAVQ
jgi:hypothetical protein